MKSPLGHVQYANFQCRVTSNFPKMMWHNDQKVRNLQIEPQKQIARWNFGDQLEIQVHNRLIVGINIKNPEKKLVQKLKNSFHEINLSVLTMRQQMNLIPSQWRFPILHSVVVMKYVINVSQARMCFILVPVLVKLWKIIRQRSEHRYGKCSSCGEYHLRNSGDFHHAK